MKKNIHILIILLIFSLIACKTNLKAIKKTNCVDNCIEIILKNINNCFEGSNNPKVDNRAEFDNRTYTLTIFIGQSAENYFQKWEIPFDELDENSILLDTTILDNFQVYTLLKKNSIKYFSIDEPSSYINEHNYYLPDYCFNKKEKIVFIEAFKRAIILSKKQKNFR